MIWIESVIEKHSHSRIEYMIKVGHFYSLYSCRHVIYSSMLSRLGAIIIFQRKICQSSQQSKVYCNDFQGLYCSLCCVSCFHAWQTLFKTIIKPLFNILFRRDVGLNLTCLFLVSGEKSVQKAFNSQQRGDPHSCANRC